MKRRRTTLDAQETITFELHQQLEAIVKDLQILDKMIPRESSRFGCLMDSKKQAEEMAIIEARKSDLLRYIQTICRDHIMWSKKLLDAGWTVSQRRRKA